MTKEDIDEIAAIATADPAEDIAAVKAARRRTALIWAGLGVVGLLLFGLVTWLLGVGPFAYRAILYEDAEIYVLNMTPRPVLVTLDNGTPFEIPPESRRRKVLYGGTTHVTTTTKGGEPIEELDITTTTGDPVLYNVEGHKCLALSDVSAFYTGDPNAGVRVDETFPRGSKVVNLPNPRVIWPRETLIDELHGADEGVAWIEMVACPLLDPNETHVLEAHLNVLLTERKKKQRELELRKKMMQKRGSEAVDEQYVPDAGAKAEGGDGSAEAPSEAPDAGATNNGEATPAEGGAAPGEGPDAG